MTTMVFDAATAIMGLTRLGRAIGAEWEPVESQTPERTQQERLFSLCDTYGTTVESLRGLKAKLSNSADELNAFLREHGFGPAFREIGRGGMGVASILDMMVEWLMPAQSTTLTVYDGATYASTNYPAFEVSVDNAEIFRVPGLDNYLVKLNTKQGDAVWLLIPKSQPEHGLDMVGLALRAMDTREQLHESRFESIIIPTIEIDAKASLDWLLGARISDHVMDQAFQLYKLRMNHNGARVKAATGLATTRSVAQPPRLYFNKPFMGWFTQSGSEFPIAVFHADTDSWNAPQGDLASL